MYRDAPPALPPPKLFDAATITIATVIGSPIGGSILWALNERRIGRPRQAWLALAIGLGFSVLMMVLGSLLPQGAAMGSAIGIAVGMRRLAAWWFAEASRKGLIGEVVYASRWMGALAGLAGVAVILAGVVGISLLVPLQ